MYVRCGIKRVNGAGQASYGEADVATYCPGLPHCTPESRTEEETTDRRGGRAGGREGGSREAGGREVVEERSGRKKGERDG